MSKQTLINFIHGNISNITVNKNSLDAIAEQFDEIDFTKHEYLLKQGKVSDYFYLSEGFARAFTFDTNATKSPAIFIQKIMWFSRQLLSFSAFRQQKIYKPLQIVKCLQLRLIN